MKNFIITAMLLSMISLLSAQQQPSRDVDITDEGVIVTYRFPAAIHTQDRLYPEAQSWLIQGFGTNHNAGQPAYPFHWDTFAVPEGTTPSVDLIAGEYADTAFVLAPAYPLLSMSDSREMTRDIVPPITSYTGFYPQQTLAMSNIQYYRGQGMVRVCTMPVQYDCEHHVIRSYSSLTYKISFTDNTGRKQKGLVTKSASSKISKTDHFMQNVTLNYSDETHDLAAEEQEDSARAATTITIEDKQKYLVFVTDAYKSAVYDFIDWKKLQGFEVHFLNKPIGVWSSSDIKNNINFYNQDGKLRYVLFVGDTQSIQSNVHYYDNQTYYSDIDYACLDGVGDEIPDIGYGRIPFENSTDIANTLAKIIEYEKSPTSNYNFYQNVSTISVFEAYHMGPDREVSRCTLSSEEIHDYLSTDIPSPKTVNRIYSAALFEDHLTSSSVNPTYWAGVNSWGNGGTVPLEIRRPAYGWNASTYDIKSSIESGSFLMTAMEHGDTITDHHWFNPLFTSSDIQQLSNNHLYPVIFTVSCQSGNYAQSPACFAENFLKQPSGGAVGIISPTADTYFGLAELSVEGMVNSIWPNPGLKTYIMNSSSDYSTIPVYELGNIMNEAFEWLGGVSPGNMGYISSMNTAYQFHRKTFQCLGDPSMMIMTAQPSYFSHPDVNYSNGKITVNTGDSGTRISFFDFDFDINTSYVGNYAEYEPEGSIVYVSISKHNYVPYLIKWEADGGGIQNETVTDKRGYVGGYVKIGTNVTNWKDPGDVLFNGADVKIKGTNIEVYPNTTITNSDVLITTY